MENQFIKYALTKVKMHLSDGDPRFESLKIDATSIRVENEFDSGDGWKLRVRYVKPVGEMPLCQLCRNTDGDDNDPSLGLMCPQCGSVKLQPETTPSGADK